MKSTTAAAVLTDPLSHRRRRSRPRTVGNVLIRGAALSEPSAHSAEHEDGRRPHPDVEHDHHERDPDARVPGRSVLHLHVLVHDPGLSAHLAHDPPRLHGKDRQDARTRGDAQEPSSLRHVASEDPGGEVPERQEHQKRAQPHHDVPGEVDRVDLTGRRPLVFGHRVEPLHDRLRSRARIQQEARPGIGMPPDTVPSSLR